MTATFLPTYPCYVIAFNATIVNGAADFTKGMALLSATTNGIRTTPVFTDLDLAERFIADSVMPSKPAIAAIPNQKTLFSILFVASGDNRQEVHPEFDPTPDSDGIVVLLRDIAVSLEE